MTLTFELDLDRVKMNQRAKYLRQRSSNSKVIIPTRRHHTHTHTRSNALRGLLNWSVIIYDELYSPLKQYNTV